MSSLGESDTAGEGVLTSILLARAQLHNARQDEAMQKGELAAAACSRRFVLPSSWIRRRRDDEPAEPKTEEAAEENSGGLVARTEFADALLTTLARVTTSPCQVTSFDDAPLLCEFGKACFGQVCVDLGLLTISHSIAEND